MTQERILELAYEAILMRWGREKERQERGKEKGYETPIADYWENIYDTEMKEIAGMIKE